MEVYKCVGHSGYIPLHPLSSLLLQERRGRERENRGREREMERKKKELSRGERERETSISYIKLLQCASLPLLPGGEGLRPKYLLIVCVI